MPALGVAELGPYARAEETPIAEAALGALIWMDQPADGLPILLDNLSGDRARVAMYAMPRLAKLIPQATLLKTLQDLLARPRLKITVQKEALRLLGNHRSDAALITLQAAWRRPNLHRDVAIAALHSARARLESEIAWEILEEAPLAEPYVALALLEVSPLSILERHHKRYLKLLLRLADHQDGRVPLGLFNAFAATSPYARGWPAHDLSASAQAAARCALDLEHDEAWRSAVNALIQLSYQPETRVITLSVARALLKAASESPTAIKDQRDLPAHQRLYALAQRALMSGVDSDAQRAFQRDLGVILSADLTFEALSVDLQLRGLRWDQPERAAGLLTGLIEAGVEGLSAALMRSPAYGNRRAVMEALLLHDSAALRRLGLALLREIGVADQWAWPYRLKLEALREDRDPRVRAEARRCWVFLE